jgi:hypothetical protein
MESNAIHSMTLADVSRLHELAQIAPGLFLVTGGGRHWLYGLPETRSAPAGIGDAGPMVPVLAVTALQAGYLHARLAGRGCGGPASLADVEALRSVSEECRMLRALVTQRPE